MKGKDPQVKTRMRVALALGVFGLFLVVFLTPRRHWFHSVPDVSTTVPSADPYRKTLGRLSHRAPPAIARPRDSDEVGAEELRAAFDGYEAAVCKVYSDTMARSGDSEKALATASAWSTDARDELREALAGERGVVRGAGDEAIALVERLSADARSPCEVFALTNLLKLMPEAEPGSWLLRIAEDPPNGSVWLAGDAIEAMGQTGRQDYAGSLARLLSPDLPAHLTLRILSSSERITGAASLAILVAGDDFPWDAHLSHGFSLALGAAEGPTVEEVISKLAESDDPLRRYAGIRAAMSRGSTPAAMPALLHAARASDLSAEEARAAVQVFEEQLPERGVETLTGIASDPTAGAHMRAAALAALPDLGGRYALAEEIARSAPAADLVANIARKAATADPAEGRRILSIFAADEAGRTALAVNAALPEDTALERLLEEYLGG